MMIYSKNITERFLQEISSHLSNNSRCKQKEYEVCILDDAVTMTPYVDVFPDIHHRKLTDKESVVYHVIVRHFPDINIDDSDNDKNLMSTFNMYVIKPNTLIKGTYRYKLSVTKKQRKWTKIA